jgi:signal transduction histidine kinase
VELHRLLGFLRQEGDRDELSAQPGLAQLPRLAASMSTSDVQVALRIDGEARPLPSTIEVSAYRIVQEALTNTVKHSTATRADVHLTYGERGLELEVVDDGRATIAPPSGPGGLGLIGMRERAALHGGRFTAGPCDGGGYAVWVALPAPAGGA